MNFAQNDASANFTMPAAVHTQCREFISFNDGWIDWAIEN
jgi:hypothetical protein